MLTVARLKTKTLKKNFFLDVIIYWCCMCLFKYLTQNIQRGRERERRNRAGGREGERPFGSDKDSVQYVWVLNKGLNSRWNIPTAKISNLSLLLRKSASFSGGPPMLDLPSVIKTNTLLLSSRANGTTSVLTLRNAMAEAVAPPMYFTFLIASVVFSGVSTIACPQLNSSLATVPNVINAILAHSFLRKFFKQARYLITFNWIPDNNIQHWLNARVWYCWSSML